MLLFAFKGSTVFAHCVFFDSLEEFACSGALARLETGYSLLSMDSAVWKNEHGCRWAVLE